MKGQLHCEFTMATFSQPSRRQHQTDAQEKGLSMTLMEALEPAVRLVGDSLLCLYISSLTIYISCVAQIYTFENRT